LGAAADLEATVFPMMVEQAPAPIYRNAT
jgi:hypothetical protein